MPAGGTWTVQNKKRPGAYINFISVPKPLGVLGDRGTVAIALPMTWGPTDDLIRLTASDLLSGKSLEKVGCDVFGEDPTVSLPYRLALSGASTALLFRSNSTGGAKATAEISEGKLTANAKYTGTTGNDITVVIGNSKITSGSKDVSILFNGIAKEVFTCSELSELADIESNWVEFEVEGEETTIPDTSGATLQGGTNGSLNSSSYSTFFNLLDTENFQCLAIEDTTTSGLATTIKNKIQMWREDRGKKVQAVVYDYPVADYEGIISVNQGFKTADDTVTTSLFPLWVASKTAGSQINQSLTASVIEGATEIIGFIPEDEIADALTAGKFVITYRQDGAVCVEQDINTLHTFTVDKNDAFSKNRVVRTLDEIGNTVALIFNRNYCGKVDNDAIGRNLYKTEIISLIDQLVGLGAVTNFDGATDITILQGNSIDSVVVDLTIQPVDSMEKLYMTVNVDA